jgi:hypothetical protein
MPLCNDKKMTELEQMIDRTYIYYDKLGINTKRLSKNDFNKGLYIAFHYPKYKALKMINDGFRSFISYKRWLSNKKSLERGLKVRRTVTGILAIGSIITSLVTYGFIKTTIENYNLQNKEKIEKTVTIETYSPKDYKTSTNNTNILKINTDKNNNAQKPTLQQLEGLINDNYPNNPDDENDYNNQRNGYWSLERTKFFDQKYYENNLQEFVCNALEKYGKNIKVANKENLIKAILAAESTMAEDKNDSSADAKGPMQIWDLTQKTIQNIAIQKGYDFRITNIYDYKQNIEAGVIYLNYLSELFPNDINLVVAAYNAGEGCVSFLLNRYPTVYNNYRYSTIKYDFNTKKHIERGLKQYMPRETREYDYVERVLNAYQDFGNLNKIKDGDYVVAIDQNKENSN